MNQMGNMKGMANGAPPPPNNNPSMAFPLLSEDFMDNMLLNMGMAANNGPNNQRSSMQPMQPIQPHVPPPPHKPMPMNPMNPMKPALQPVQPMQSLQSMHRNNSAPESAAQIHQQQQQQQKQQSPPTVQKPEKPLHPIEVELVSMGFEKDYVVRASTLYKEKFKNKPLRLEVLTEIITLLQQRDQQPVATAAKKVVAQPGGNGGEIVLKYTSRPFSTSEHALTQERGFGR